LFVDLELVINIATIIDRENLLWKGTSQGLGNFFPFCSLKGFVSLPSLVPMLLQCDNLSRGTPAGKLTLYMFLTYKVEEDEVGGTCGTNGGEEERV
jgi:hypothetical protein